ncbi:MAG TPA: translocation/assembly module TamB domain-containing protein [Bacteroidales bacterium]
MKKKLLKLLLNIFLVLLAIPFAITFLFREPLIQTITARLATKILSEQLGYSISVRTININFFDGIVLKDLLVKDHHDNVMLGVVNLKAMPAYVDYTVVGLAFLRVQLDGAEFRYGFYKDEAQANLDYLLDKISGTDTTSTSSGGGSFKLMVRSLSLRNSSFRFFNEDIADSSLKTMDYANMIFDSIYLEASRFVLIDDSLNLRIEKLSTIEKCGLKVDELVADFSISGTGLHAHNMLLKAGKSDINMDLDFNYKTWATYSYFIDSVEMVGTIRPSYFEMSDVGYFSETMLSMPNMLGLSGSVKGTVSHLTGKELRVHYGENTRFSGNAMIKGLPDFFTSYMQADIREFVTTPCEAKTFRLPVDESALDFLDYFSCNRPISIKGDFNGYYTDFVANLDIKSKEGNMAAEVAFKQERNDTINFTAMLQAQGITLGKILKQEDILGKVDVSLTARGRGISIDKMALNGNAFIQSIGFLGYQYKKIQLTADYRDNTVKGTINSKDKNFIIEGNAVVNLLKEPEIFLKANISRVFLSELLGWQDREFGFSTIADIHIVGIDPATMTGEVILDTATLFFENNLYKWNSFVLSKSIDSNQFQRISLNNDFIQAKLTGKYNVMTMPGQIIDLVNYYFNFTESDTTIATQEENYAKLYLDLKNSKMIENELVPGLYVSPNTILNASFNFDKKEINVYSDIRELDFKGIALKNNNIEINTLNKKIQYNFDSERIILKDSSETDKTVFGIDDFSIRTDVGNDSLQFGIYWENRDSLHLNSAIGEGLIARHESAINLSFDRSEFIINDTLWTIGPQNLVVYDSAGLTFRNFDIFGGKSQVSINGTVPEVNNDSIEVSFKDFNISNLDIATKLANIDMDGHINGLMQYSIIGENPTFISDLTINNFVFNDEVLGTARIMNTWDNTNNSIFVNSQIIREGNSGRGEVFSIRGLYYPFKDEDAIDLKVNFNRFKLVTLEPIVAEFVRDIEGSASGEIKIDGSFQKPVFKGKIEFYRTSLVVNYLNTKYSFSNDIAFEKDKIDLSGLVIYDTLGNNATINGSLYHYYFSDPYFDFTINTDRLLFFNTNKKMNDLYYGTAITSGNIRVSGSPRDISLDMDVQTAEGTNVYLPLDYSVEISDKDYIIFVDHTIDKKIQDSIEMAEKKRKDEENLKYSLNLKMNINSDAKVTIFLPSDMGKIESRGNGDLTMKVNSDGDFTIIGDYIVNKGVFNFILGNLVQKRFELVNGGRISWSGDPYLANVSIKGLYKVKTSISNLGVVVDSSSNYSGKATVECYAILTDQLLNPNIRFEIKIPDLDPDLQRQVFSNLDTTNQAMMNEQMISLLVLGTFSFSNASNVSLSSSYYTVLSNQLSSMLSRLSDAVDIGVNYKPGDNVSQNEFDVALSSQFLDDRLLVEGSFGMTYDKAQQNASNIVGDVDVSYNLTKDGRWILKGYNHSNVNSYYNYSNYDKYAPYTQGVGVAFRKDFNNLAELFQRTRPKKKDRKEQENEESENDESIE